MTTAKTLLISTLALLTSCTGSGEPRLTRSGNWRDDIRTLAEGYFHHPAWGVQHAERDYRLAKELAQRDHVPVDDDVLYAAAYLHDIAMFEPWASLISDHADQGAKVVVGLLAQTDFPKTKLESVQNAIRTHMYDRVPSGPEATYLHDADALDWLGPIGIARIIAMSDRKDGEKGVAQALASAAENANDAPNGILSAAGKAEAAVRIAEGQNCFQFLPLPLRSREGLQRFFIAGWLRFILRRLAQ